MADIPRPIWLVIKHALVPILRLFYKPFYEEYTGPLWVPYACECGLSARGLEPV